MLHFYDFYVQISILCCDNAVLLLWLGFGTKTPWLGLGKAQGLISNTCRHKNSWRYLCVL